MDAPSTTEMELNALKPVREAFDPGRWDSVHSACIRTGLTRKSLLALLKRGTIPSVRLNARKYVISRVAVDRFMEKMATPGDGSTEGGRLKHQPTAR